jgi:hypothetical protein
MGECVLQDFLLPSLIAVVYTVASAIADIGLALALVLKLRSISTGTSFKSTKRYVFQHHFFP